MISGLVLFNASLAGALMDTAVGGDLPPGWDPGHRQTRPGCYPPVQHGFLLPEPESSDDQHVGYGAIPTFPSRFPSHLCRRPKRSSCRMSWRARALRPVCTDLRFPSEPMGCSRGARGQSLWSRSTSIRRAVTERSVVPEIRRLHPQDLLQRSLVNQRDYGLGVGIILGR